MPAANRPHVSKATDDDGADCEHYGALAAIPAEGFPPGPGSLGSHGLTYRRRQLWQCESFADALRRVYLLLAPMK
jgi:hypothetical protein